MLNLSRISIFSASLVALFVAITACSSTDDASVPIPSKNATEPGNGDKSTGGGGGAKSPDGNGGGGAAPPPGNGAGDNPSACAATATEEDCDTCCYEPQQEAVDKAFGEVDACICETTCATACASACSPDGGAPTEACNTCAKGCETKANEACQKDVACAQYLKCVEDAQCAKKAKQ